MKTMIFGDLHQAPNLERVEAAIAREAPVDKVVFLGDYFDQWDDQPADSRRMALWLKQSLAQPNRVHLWGNHDLAYAFPGNRIVGGCPGFTADKCAAIAAVLGPRQWAGLRLSFWAGPSCLVTHAGWSRRHAPPPGSDLRAFLQAEETAAWTALHRGQPHWVWAVGPARGGSSPFRAGGLVWCDLTEFQPVPELDQIFGHTPGTAAVTRQGVRSRNWCVDTTDQTGVRHYAMWSEGDITVHPLDPTPEPARKGKGGRP